MKYIYRVLDYMAWFWFMEWQILVYIINRIIHGRLEIRNLSSRVHIRYLTRSLRSLVRYWWEHSKINSISLRVHVLFSIYSATRTILFIIIIIFQSLTYTLTSNWKRTAFDSHVSLGHQPDCFFLWNINVVVLIAGAYINELPM